MRQFFYNRTAYPWVSYEDSFFHGYFIYDNQKYEGEYAIRFLIKCFKSKSYMDIISQLNGIFGFIISSNNKLFFGVDRLRGLPLFYSIIDGELFVGDNTYDIISNIKTISINKKALRLYEYSWLFVNGNQTLINELFQVEASSIIVYDPHLNKIEILYYYQYFHRDFYTKDDAQNLFKENYIKIASNLVNALSGRTAVVPLSGGADSRMIVTMLSNMKYKNVICYSYGKPENLESKISQEIARKFDYEWIMIPYNKSIWKNLDKQECNEYEKYEFQFVSTPHYQDYPAVKYLKENNLIPLDSVFIPGHSGDLIAGSQVSSFKINSKYSTDSYLYDLARIHFHTQNKRIIKYLEKDYYIQGNRGIYDYVSLLEWFNISERQAKYIVNSCRIYEFFGFEWLIPLWDISQFEFWSHIDLPLLFNRNLYFQMTHDEIKSTNDKTLMSTIIRSISNIPFCSFFLKKIKKISLWWCSNLYYEHRVSFFEYFYACIVKNPSFSVQTIMSKKIIKKLKRKINDIDK